MTSPRRRLDDILVRCEQARDLVDRGRATFDADALMRHAAKSILTDIGEAAKNLGPLADQISDVPWSQISRMRDRVSHRYFDVDYGVVWDTLVYDLPDLERAVRDFLRTLDR